MSRTAENRPPALPAKPSTPKSAVAAARQKSVGRPPALKPGPAKPRKRRPWPILEVAVILVLVKIAAGAFYIWNRPGEAGWNALAALFRSLPAVSGPGLGAAEPQPEAAMLEALEELPKDPVEMPREALLAGPPELLLEKPAETVAENQPEATAERPPEAVLADYLAAALKATQPAPAQAAQLYAAQAQAAPASAVAGALTAGALMVVSGQNAAAVAAENIPLPPGEEELWQPAAKLPPADLPRIGTGEAASSAAGADLENLRKLRDREQELARREALLTSRTGALGALELELAQRLKETETAKKETEGLLQRNEAVLAEQQALAEQQKKEDEALKDVRLKHLVTAYTGMKPEQAGSLVNSMDDDVAVAILSAMPGGKAGKILAMVNPDKAARLTKAISEKRIDPNMLLNDEDETQGQGSAAPPPPGP